MNIMKVRRQSDYIFKADVNQDEGMMERGVIKSDVKFLTFEKVNNR